MHCIIHNRIESLFENLGLGSIELPIETVSGGLLHRMYKVRAGERKFAVKHLNPLIMKRPDAVLNFENAERLESILESSGIPIVPALRFFGQKRQLVDEDYFYVFNWQDGNITDCYNITPEQCRLVGGILGSMHALNPKTVTRDEVLESHIDFDLYKSRAKAENHELHLLLSQNDTLLHYAERELNEARRLLPNVVCISDEDMDPKNVMWENGLPYVIDLECLEYGNPVSHALQLALQWAGSTVCHINYDHISTFFDGYLNTYDNGFRKYDEVFGIAYTWLEWLEYNLRRALGECADENEKMIGIAEAKNTLDRICCLHENESDIKRVLSKL